MKKQIIKRPLINVDSKPVSIKFLNDVDVKPQPKWKKAWYFLYLLSVMIPNYILKNNMYVELSFEDGSKYIKEILKGYQCDLASLPRIVWRFWTPDAIEDEAINHDTDYQSEVFKKALNDDFFKLAMEEKKKPKKIKFLFYSAVKLFGWNVYRKHTDESVLEGRKYINIYKYKNGRYVDIKTGKRLDLENIKRR